MCVTYMCIHIDASMCNAWYIMVMQTTRAYMYAHVVCMPIPKLCNSYVMSHTGTNITLYTCAQTSLDFGLDVSSHG